MHSPVNKLNEMTIGALYLVEKIIRHIIAITDAAAEISAYLLSFFSSKAFVVMLEKREYINADKAIRKKNQVSVT